MTTKCTPFQGSLICTLEQRHQIYNMFYSCLMPICTFMLCQRVAHYFICSYYYPLYMIVAEKQVFLQKLTSAAHLVEFIKLHNCPLMVINLINPGIYSVGCRLRRSKLIKNQRRFDRVFSLTLGVTLKIMYLNPWLPKQKRHTNQETMKNRIH